MPDYIGQRDYKHGTPERLGILITNLGTPDAPTPSAVRRYLREFLWDPRVIEIARPLWWVILQVILLLRPARSARAYKKVWTESGSPLLVIARRQLDALQTELGKRLPGPFSISLGMRYGNPSLRQALDQLRKDNAQRILILPLYPQYSATTTASTFDAVSRELQNWRRLPELRFINHYHDLPGYISALAASIKEHWEQQGRGELLLFSFHGIPKRYLLNGDPYHCQCQKTARLVAEKLELKDEDWQISFQSRVGREEWLRPYTDETIVELAEGGHEKIDVVCPGFSADCLETLEEIVIQNKEIFINRGGRELSYIPALNDRADHIRFLADLITNHAQGWKEASPLWDKQKAMQTAEQERQRARRLGEAQ